MYINNMVRNTFSAIKNVENKSREIKNILNGIILSCYNTIISFIKPTINIKNDFLGLRKNISNVENKNYQGESTPVKLDNKEKTDKKENEEVFDKQLSEAQRKIKSDEIKASIINDIISFLKEIPELEKEKITEFKKELEFHSKWILFSGNKISLENSKNNFLESIADSLLNSDDKIKSNFGTIDSYKFFLKESINNTVENILYKN
ncbi:hypothetical protein [Proteus terrae]|uniref:hypothetical protein n=1 Tax=Proteus terrae TaxID=1574161 RepID=UPI0021BA7D27|nr:hypothetical protein [Proteus terrae]MCT8231097.1 hypothetical protein [Proteus terrae]